jgi:16S rRNA C1402 N4-methylase RsmH
MGSGTTGVAAVDEGFRFIGIERDPQYLSIAEKRITYAKENVNVSSETKQLGSIREVTDNDDDMSQIGDLDGGFSELALENYFRHEGERGFTRICEHLIYMGANAREVWHRTRDGRKAVDAVASCAPCDR